MRVLVCSAALVVAVGCGSSGSGPDAAIELALRLRTEACPDGGCVEPDCPPFDGGRFVRWRRDLRTQGCCPGSPNDPTPAGFESTASQVACETLPECNGYPIGAEVPAGDGCNACRCTAANTWSCSADDCSGAPAGRACGYWQGGCPAGSYCAFLPAERCSDGDAPSVCRPIPSSCTAEQATVCGCDGREHLNRCEAGRAGTGIRNVGACGQQRPAACINQFRPVCGRDGQSYGNACLAAQAGTEVRHQGVCKATCDGPQDCGFDEYCSACSQGQCLPRPSPPFACTAFAPVCGCDGESYSCAELAPYGGTAVRSEGLCP
jgi:hypothetical protein